MTDTANLQPARFGTTLGLAPGDVAVYSSHYESADPHQLPNRQAYRSYVDGIFMGYKWQCVEFARRWLYLNRGYVFDDIAMAYDIFELRSARIIESDRLLPLYSFRNGSRRRPVPGCLLIWEEGGHFEDTGHVAIVTEVSDDWVRIVEQNAEHHVWSQHQGYSRELRVTLGADGEFLVSCTYPDTTLLGWVIQTDDAYLAESTTEFPPQVLNLQLREVPDSGRATKPWLDSNRPDEQAYIQMMGGHRLSFHDDCQHSYFRLSETAHKELKHATNELHAMFLHATNEVLTDDKLLAHFNLPEVIWPRIHQSWDNRKNQMITGRFDFAISEHGLKLYEYNADSASCLMECGKIQAQWAEHFGVTEGWSAGRALHERLVDAWHDSGVGADTLHIMHDGDLEETYHALYMQSLIEEAGIRCKRIRGVAGLSFDDEGRVQDGDGEEIRWVWKTWAWETALDQLRAEISEETASVRKRSLSPRLVDVLLRPEVMVFEPLWTLIPSNKAILPVLWRLYPNHPYLLDSQYYLTESLAGKGYAAKPIAGRCGANISIVDKHNNVLEETRGRFEQQDQIYQQLFKLPAVDTFFVQVGTFTADGKYAGACVRVDTSPVITKNSDILALRVVPDSEL